MLLNQEVVLDVAEGLQPEDFYFPAHQLIYQAIIELFSSGSQIDVLIVSGRLDRLNQLERVGGAPYLHTLISEVPTSANARYYAEIVEEKSLLRQLVNAGTHVVQLGYEGEDGMEIEALVDRAQQEVFGISRNNQGEDYRVLSELLKPTIDELTQIAQGGGKHTKEEAHWSQDQAHGRWCCRAHARPLRRRPLGIRTGPERSGC